MPTWGRPAHRAIVDVAVGPSLPVHGEVAAEFVVVPEGTLPGATLVDGVWTNRAPSPEQPAPAAAYATMHPMDFYLAFKPRERMLIKALASPAGIPANSPLLGGTNPAIPQDAEVAEFWATYEMATQLVRDINPNLSSVQEGLAYLAAPVAPTPAVITADRIPQISAGIPQ